MKVIFRNFLAVLLGIAVGSLVNMALVMLSGRIIPPPAGADITTLEGLRSSMHLFEPKHFLFPFVAHALGTLGGAYVAAMVAVSRRIGIALVIGVAFLSGGAANVYLLPSPLWFNIVDLAGAYLPMAWIGGMLAARKTLF